MLAELKFVLGAVAKKDLVPMMTHFAIEDGTIRSYNGQLALCSPIAINLNCKPKAHALTQAIANCSPDHVVTLSMTETGRLRIANGPYRAIIECTEEEFPRVLPNGDIIPVHGESLLRAFRNIQPFIGNDASRTWSNGVLLHGKSAFATNNVIMVEYWIGTDLPFTVNIPRECVREVLRVGETPTSCQLDDSSITFHFPNGKWIRSSLYGTNWPEAAERMFDVVANPIEIHPEFFNAIESISSFTDKINNVYFKTNEITSQRDGGEEGASYALDNFPYRGAYALPMLELLNGTVEKIDWSLYPKPCIFYGDNMRGAIIGRWISDDELEHIRKEEAKDGVS
jgi:DNA polymerase III sliding clamp (beta) subunit (PCNA family)